MKTVTQINDADYQAELAGERKFRNEAMKEARKTDAKINKLKTDRDMLLTLLVRVRNELLAAEDHLNQGHLHRYEFRLVDDINSAINLVEKGE